jgi:hypothetical protein
MMLTSDDRFEIGMKFLQRFKPATAARIEHSHPLFRKVLSPFPHATAGLAAAELGKNGDPRTLLSRDDKPPQPLSIPEVLAQTGPLPPQTVLLGICEDGLPFLFDLTNPAPGSLLIIGDAGSGKTRLVKSILASAMQLSKPEQLSFSIITPDASLYQDEMLAIEYCRHFLSSEETSVAKLIENLAQLTEKRRRSNTPGPLVLLVIDDLAACLQSLDDEQFRRFYWLIKHGPRSRIWVLATFDPASIEWMDERILDAFRTRLIGPVTDPELAAYLAGDERFSSGGLDTSGQFCVPFGDDWIRFWICDPS